MPTFDVMAKKHHHQQHQQHHAQPQHAQQQHAQPQQQAHEKPGRWAGEEVESRAAPGQAERAADRAEGNAPAKIAPGHRDEPPEVEPEDERRRAPSGETPDEKVADAAEAHREAEEADHGHRPPHGKL